MLDAFENRDQVYYDQAASKQVVGFLTNEIARLACNIIISNDFISGGGYADHPSHSRIPPPPQHPQPYCKQQPIYQQPQQPFYGQKDVFQAWPTSGNSDYQAQHKPGSIISDRYDTSQPDSSAPPPYSDEWNEADRLVLTEKLPPSSATRTFAGRLWRTTTTTRSIPSVIRPTSLSRMTAGSTFWPSTGSSVQQSSYSFSTSSIMATGHVKFATQYGQPTWMTHSHLMNQGEITPGITATEYELRRSNLMQSLPKGSIVILTSHRTRFMTNNILYVKVQQELTAAYPFHQQTDFYYLCGFNEPDSALVLEKNDSARGYRMTMFVAPKNANIEMWEGARTGLDAAKEIFGADEAIDSNLFRYRIVDITGRYESVYFDYPGPSMFLPMDIAKKLHHKPVVSSMLSRLIGLFKTYAKQQQSAFTFTSHPRLDPDSNMKTLLTDSDVISSSKSLSPLIQEMRVIKSEAEIKIMRQAGEISGKAFIETMKFTNPQRWENQIYAKFDYECRMRGSQMMAYVPVVAGGSNALTMHYVNNDQPLHDGDLLLMDAGGELNGYASDITRTWPTNGKFTQAQKDLYEIVLNANKECIKARKEQGLSLNQIHDVSMRLTKEGLSRLGIRPLAHDVDRRLYPHHVGHYLGMDVHDTGDISRSRPLREGMVITIEPGLYIPRDPAYPERYQGIGIRIEDNVMVGKTAPYVLSVTAPKEIVDIEYCCASGKE
ncbi:hypothetical protein BGZ65_008808 [Modicella reniformis]|uniref:Aminopeptidase P N-terminal domain-containing protein n=1 Tax=Modicella reniformis TaxID=1440133 RepID=A0A9P6M236_9FUNG|nr:hypothetical protein BGZ65_008808 [Modicella reniformis]